MKRNRLSFTWMILTGLLLAGLTFKGCGLTGEPLTEEQMVYAGSWESTPNPGNAEYIYLHITPGGRVEYERQGEGSKNSISAPIQKWEGNDFVVGALGIETRFEVSQPPQKDGDQWIMVVDGRTLVKFAE